MCIFTLETICYYINKNKEILDHDVLNIKYNKKKY